MKDVSTNDKSGPAIHNAKQGNANCIYCRNVGNVGTVSGNEADVVGMGTSLLLLLLFESINDVSSVSDTTSSASVVPAPPPRKSNEVRVV
jgi:hypothetical protein